MYDFVRTVLKKISPIKGILYFLVLFFFFEFIWKLCVHEVDNGETLLVLGSDFTSLIYPICLFTAKITYWVIHSLLGYSGFHIDGLFIYFEDSLKMQIVFGCTGLKQVLQFSFVIIGFWGPWKKKLIFIPLSILILFVVNILRLVITSFVIKDGFPEWFIAFNTTYNGQTWDGTSESYWRYYVDWYHFFHDRIFKWIYYDGILFLLWIFWNEKINIPYQKMRKADINK